MSGLLVAEAAFEPRDDLGEVVVELAGAVECVCEQRVLRRVSNRARSTAREPMRLLASVRELERDAAPELGQGPPQAEIVPVRLDLSSAASIEESCAELGEHLDEVDVLINNAGEFVGGTVEQLDIEAMYATVQVNLTGLMHLTRRVLPGMLAREKGKIVNQGSIISDLEFPGTGV